MNGLHQGRSNRRLAPSPLELGGGGGGPRPGGVVPRPGGGGGGGGDRLDQGGIIVSGAVDFSGNGMPGHFRPLYRLQKGQKGFGVCISADPGRIATGRKDGGHARPEYWVRK